MWVLNREPPLSLCSGQGTETAGFSMFPQHHHGEGSNLAIAAMALTPVGGFPGSSKRIAPLGAPCV
jgi:hypothetical protein